MFINTINNAVSCWSLLWVSKSIYLIMTNDKINNILFKIINNYNNIILILYEKYLLLKKNFFFTYSYKIIIIIIINNYKKNFFVFTYREETKSF